jgi:hypothetical protein
MLVLADLVLADQDFAAETRIYEKQIAGVDVMHSRRRQSSWRGLLRLQHLYQRREGLAAAASDDHAWFKNMLVCLYPGCFLCGYMVLESIYAHERVCQLLDHVVSRKPYMYAFTNICSCSCESDINAVTGACKLEAVRHSVWRGVLLPSV